MEAARGLQHHQPTPNPILSPQSSIPPTNHNDTDGEFPPFPFIFSLVHGKPSSSFFLHPAMRPKSSRERPETAISPASGFRPAVIEFRGLQRPANDRPIGSIFPLTFPLVLHDSSSLLRHITGSQLKENRHSVPGRPIAAPLETQFCRHSKANPAYTYVQYGKERKGNP